MQDAITVAPPGCDPETVPVPGVLVLLLALTENALEEVQVSGGLVKVAPRESSTVAVTVWVPPLLRTIVLSGEPVTCKLMDCTGQVTKVMGMLETLLAVAKICVKPGTSAVACAWLKRRPLAVVLSVTTLVWLSWISCQLNGPTVALMSSP